MAMDSFSNNMVLDQRRPPCPDSTLPLVFPLLILPLLLLPIPLRHHLHLTVNTVIALATQSTNAMTFRVISRRMSFVRSTNLGKVECKRKVQIWVFILSFPLSKMTIMTMIDMSSSRSALLFRGLFVFQWEYLL